MIGFPGAHYDYRDWIDRHNQRQALFIGDGFIELCHRSRGFL